MANRNTVLAALGIFAFCASSTSDVFAQASDPVLKVNPSKRGALLDVSASGGAGTARAFTSYLESGHSYECALYGNNTSSDGTDPRARFDIGNITDGSSNTVIVSERGNASPIVNGFSDGSVRNLSRVTVSPTSTGLYTFPFLVDVNAMGAWTSGTGSFSMWINCNDTTLFGGFNTFASNFNFLELTNISNTTITGKIKAVDFNGNVVIADQPFSIGAGLRRDFDLHTTIGPQKYGTVIVTHDASAGSLLGYVSQYTGTAASFELRVSLPLYSRNPS